MKQKKEGEKEKGKFLRNTFIGLAGLTAVAGATVLEVANRRVPKEITRRANTSEYLGIAKQAVNAKARELIKERMKHPEKFSERAGIALGPGNLQEIVTDNILYDIATDFRTGKMGFEASRIPYLELLKKPHKVLNPKTYPVALKHRGSKVATFRIFYNDDGTIGHTEPEIIPENPYVEELTRKGREYAKNAIARHNVEKISGLLKGLGFIFIIISPILLSAQITGFSILNQSPTRTSLFGIFIFFTGIILALIFRKKIRG